MFLHESTIFPVLAKLFFAQNTGSENVHTFSSYVFMKDLVIMIFM